MRIRSLSHTGMTVSSFEKSVRWYYDMFGFRLLDEQYLPREQVAKLYNLYALKDTDIRLGILRAPRGGVIELFEFSQAMPRKSVIWNKPGFTHLTLDVKNVDRWYKELSQRNVKFLSAPQKTGNIDWVFLQDPDGNLIELIDLKYNYFIIRWLGSIVGKVMCKNKFKKYYTSK